MHIFKRPERVNLALLELKVSSIRRPFDDWLQRPYGLKWESPGYINMLECKLRNQNVTRLANFATEHNVRLHVVLPQEYVAKYKSIYEREFPDGVTLCESQYDYHTVKRMRHLLYFKLGEISQKDWEFLAGIGKKLGAGHEISDKQRSWVRDLLKEHGNNEHNILDGAYTKIGDYKHPF
jgi:hypothetical protein